MMRQWLLVVLCLVPAGLWAHSGQKHAFPMVAFARPLPAPEFSLSGLGDNNVRLADYQGKFVLLNFWATWCPPCVQEMPSMERLHQRLTGRGMVVLALSQDDEGRDLVQPFVRKLKLTFPVALDTEQKVARLFGVKDLPLTFLITPDGEVVAAVKGGLDWDSPAAVEFIEHYLVASQPRIKPVLARP
jgi:peroxiredoxin